MARVAYWCVYNHGTHYTASVALPDGTYEHGHCEYPMRLQGYTHALEHCARLNRELLEQLVDELPELILRTGTVR